MRKIFMGSTSYQMPVFDVAKYSIERYNDNVQIFKLDQAALRSIGIYTRENKPNESTEFSLTRFLTPYLAGYKGWVLFMDNDMVCLDDIEGLFQHADDSKAVMVVKHNYDVVEGEKLDGQINYAYPRKNWSSVILWNAGHPSNAVVTPELVNNATGQFLHRFMWLEDEEIGELPVSWNYLVDEYKTVPLTQDIKMLHYTLGGPYFKSHTDCSYADVWLEAYKDMSGKEWTEEDLI